MIEFEDSETGTSDFSDNLPDSIYDLLGCCVNSEPRLIK